MERNTILLGDAYEMLKTLPNASVHCVVTSPPYWGLRDYGVEGQIGLEESINFYIYRLMLVFSEIHRVLRPDGVCWVNLGDSFANDGKWGGTTSGKHTKALHGTAVGRTKRKSGRKPKDLIGIPWLLAFTMQINGWWLRSEIIWAKKNPMPESVKDRLSRTHETVFQFTKSERYYFDLDAIREPPRSQGRKPGNKSRAFVDRDPKHHAPHKQRPDDSRSYHPAGKNPGDVWFISSAPFKGAHFATMPPEVAQRCILSSTSPQVCEHCGAPWQRVTKKQTHYEGNSARAGRSKEDINTSGKWRSDNMHGNKNLKSGPVVSIQIIGWKPTCKCENEGSARAVILDPFFGAGTTGYVAAQHGRDYIGIELNPTYKLLAEDRLSKGIQMTLFDAA